LGQTSQFGQLEIPIRVLKLAQNLGQPCEFYLGGPAAATVLCALGVARQSPRAPSICTQQGKRPAKQPGSIRAAQTKATVDRMGGGR
jgi:hypothetical protein